MKVKTNRRKSFGVLLSLLLFGLSALPATHALADETGGWTPGPSPKNPVPHIGFASRKRIPEGCEVIIRVVEVGNSLGIVATYSGNGLFSDKPGRLWNRNEVKQGKVLRLRIGIGLAGRSLAIRSGANPSGYDRPLESVATENGYRLKYAGGRVLHVRVRQP